MMSFLSLIFFSVLWGWTSLGWSLSKCCSSSWFSNPKRVLWEWGSGCRGDDELWSRASCVWVGVNWRCHLLQPRAELNSISDRNSGSGDTGGVLCGWHHPVWCQQEEGAQSWEHCAATYQVQKDGWGLGPCPPPLLNLVTVDSLPLPNTCQHQHQVTGHNHSSAYYPLAPDSQDDESSGQHYHQVTCHHPSPASHPLPAPQDHPGQGQTKGKNKKSYRLKCIQCNFISIWQYYLMMMKNTIIRLVIPNRRTLTNFIL